MRLDKTGWKKLFAVARGLLDSPLCKESLDLLTSGNLQVQYIDELLRQASIDLEAPSRGDGRNRFRCWVREDLLVLFAALSVEMNQREHKTMMRLVEVARAGIRGEPDAASFERNRSQMDNCRNGMLDDMATMDLFAYAIRALYHMANGQFALP